jgi:hypothetical protein
MYLRINAGGSTLAAANTHMAAPELAPLGVEGALLAFDFTAFDTLEAALESIRTMDRYVGGLIADADNRADIIPLSSLKVAIAGVERTVMREYAYKEALRADQEAIEPEEIRQLHAEQDASTTESPESNGADPVDEENATYGEENQSPRRRKR